MLAILLLAAEKHKATFIAPIGIGLALFVRHALPHPTLSDLQVAELLGVYYTGGSLNPARSFGPSAVLGTFEGYRECVESSMKSTVDDQIGSTGSALPWAHLSLLPFTSFSYVIIFATGSTTD